MYLLKNEMTANKMFAEAKKTVKGKISISRIKAEKEI